MLTSFYKVIAVLLMVLPISVFKLSAEDRDSILLRRIELFKNSSIFKIINEVVSEEKQKNYKITFFSLNIKEGQDIDENYIRIVAHTKNRLSNWDGYSGYDIIDSIPVIVINNSNMKIRFSNSQNRYFPMDSPDDPPYIYDPQEWFFLIKNNDVARYVYSIGWIWDKPNQKGKKQTDSSFRLTRPRRKSKK